jgi:WD40 repeat protein
LTVRIWDIGTGKSKCRFRCGKNVPVSMDLSADNQFLACGCMNGDVVVWNCVSGQTVWVRRPFDGRITDTKWSVDGSLLYGSDIDGRFWAFGKDGEVVMSNEAIASTIDSITVTDLNLVVTCGRSLRGGIVI